MNITDALSKWIVFQIVQDSTCGTDTTHPVDPAAGWRGRRTEIEALSTSSIGVPSHCRSKNRLAKGARATVDVSADVVRIVLLRLCGGDGAASKDEIAKTRRESFDLRFNS